MQQQHSDEKYKTVSVKIRQTKEIITMSASSGNLLRNHLTQKGIPQHVTIKDINGKEYTKQIFDIESVMPDYEDSNFKILDMPKIHDIPDEIRKHRIEKIREMKQQYFDKRSEK